jgi:hypothetical protein
LNKEAIMEKAFEFFDTWLRSQKDFLNNWIRSQKELMDNWFDSIKKIQMSFSTMAGTLGGSPQLLELFNSWFTTMISLTKAFTEGITNLQNAWEDDSRETDGNEQGDCKTVLRSPHEGWGEEIGERRIEKAPGPNRN